VNTRDLICREYEIALGRNRIKFLGTIEICYAAHHKSSSYD
jgi:hypothetical protein